ncbi:hypothetical protein FRC06_011761 [Ceratobasidium sp. 370]|nr:hypothetical protein FRC06_011761 [Ceratobasidium sp. 370]
MSTQASAVGSELRDAHHGTQPSGDHSSSTELVNNIGDGPASKRRVKRALERRVAGKAVEIDQELRVLIEDAAGDLHVSSESVAQKFAIVAPIGETRKAMWWNGLVSEKADEWRDEYDGAKKMFLPWVSGRIRDEKINEDIDAEEQERLAKVAETKRAANKGKKASAMTRTKSIKAAEKKIDDIYGELQQLSAQVGIEFALFTTRGSLEDDMDPSFLSSDKLKMFLQGHLNLPPKQLLKLMDMSVVGGVDGMSATVANEKELYRQRLRRQLNTSFCSTIKDLGHDITNFKHIKYKNYDELVRKYRIVLRGYPLTTDGRIVRPSDFPGGVAGLVHAERQLESGAWGFDKIDESRFDEWETGCNTAKENGNPMPLPPHIPVAGTEYVKSAKTAKAGEGETRKTAQSRKRAADDKGEVTRKKRRVTAKEKEKTSTRSAVKSREFIEDDSSEEE